MNEKRDAYVQKLKAQLDEWNADINKLEAKSHQAEAGAKIEYHKRIADLRERLKEVGDKIGDGLIGSLVQNTPHHIQDPEKLWSYMTNGHI